MSFEFRPYQLDAIAATGNHYRSGARAVMLQIPTGGGKSKTAGEIARRSITKKNWRVWKVAHRQELIEQLYETCTKDFQLPTGIVKAGYPLRDMPMQVCSIQTVINRLDLFKGYEPNLIIFDEAHRSASDSYQQIVQAFPNALILGLSATPVRTDNRGLGDYYQAIHVSPSIPWFIQEGYLTPVHYVRAKNDYDGLEFDRTKGDYKPKDLAKVVSVKKRAGHAVDAWFEYGRGRPTVVFAVNSEDGHNLVEAFNKYPECRAAFVDWETDKDHGKGTRKAIFDAAKRGELTHLINVNIATEGVDIPEWSCVQLLRKTKSVVRYYQSVGRGLRPAPWADKQDCIVIDQCGVSDPDDPDSLGSVLDPRDWSLKDSEPVRVTQTREEKLAEQGIGREEVIVEDGTAVFVEVRMELGQRPAWLTTFEDLLQRKAANGYKPAWVAYELKKTYPELSVEDWRQVAKVLDFKHQWVNHFLGKPVPYRRSA